MDDSVEHAGPAVAPAGSWPDLTADPQAPPGIGNRLLFAAVLLGVLADLLRGGGGYGINVAVWIVALTVSAALLAPWRRRRLQADRLWLFLPVLFFAACWAWRDARALVTFDLIAVLGLLALITMPPLRPPLRTATFIEHGWALVIGAVMGAVGALVLAVEHVAWRRLWPFAGHGQRQLRVARGLLIAAPIVLVFGSLFAQADAVFSARLGSLFDFDAASIVTHASIVAAWSWLAAGALRHAVLTDEGSPTLPAATHRGMLAGTEVTIVGGLLNLLFLAFVTVQLGALFGGADYVERATTLTYSEYARAGFFELLAVTALVLPLLVVGDWLRADSSRSRLAFRVAGTALVVQLSVVIASSAYRLHTYVEAYGLTELRFYALGMLAWLALVFLVTLGTLLRNERRRLPYGMVLAGIVVLAAINVINPDAFIARTNIERTGNVLAREGGGSVRLVASDGAYDDGYVGGHLSADAVPTVIAALDKLPRHERRAAATRMLNRWADPPRRDWRAWNLARARAATLVDRHCLRLEDMAYDYALVDGTPCDR